MTRNEIIAQELSADPLGRGYSGLSDTAARDDMNSPYRTLEQGVWLSDLYQYLSHEMNDPDGTGGGGAWPVLVMLKELAEDGTIQGEMENSPHAKQVAINLMGFVAKATDAGGQLIWLDFSTNIIQYTFDTLRNVQIISQAQRDKIPTLSDIPQTRGNELKVGTLTTYEIASNRP